MPLDDPISLPEPMWAFQSMHGATSEVIRCAERLIEFCPQLGQAEAVRMAVVIMDCSRMRRIQ